MFTLLSPAVAQIKSVNHHPNSNTGCRCFISVYKQKCKRRSPRKKPSKQNKTGWDKALQYIYIFRQQRFSFIGEFVALSLEYLIHLHLELYILQIEGFYSHKVFQLYFLDSIQKKYAEQTYMSLWINTIYGIKKPPNSMLLNYFKFSNNLIKQLCSEVVFQQEVVGAIPDIWSLKTICCRKMLKTCHKSWLERQDLPLRVGNCVPQVQYISENLFIYIFVFI